MLKFINKCRIKDFKSDWRYVNLLEIGGGGGGVDAENKIDFYFVFSNKLNRNHTEDVVNHLVNLLHVPNHY